MTPPGPEDYPVDWAADVYDAAAELTATPPPDHNQRPGPQLPGPTELAAAAAQLLAVVPDLLTAALTSLTRRRPAHPLRSGGDRSC